MASPSERKAAQRRTAKQLKAGQNPIEGFGKKARETAKNYISPKTSMFSSSVVPGAEVDPKYVQLGPVQHEQVKTHTLSGPAQLSQAPESALPHVLSGIGSGGKPKVKGNLEMSAARNIGSQFSAISQPHFPAMPALRNAGPTAQTPMAQLHTLQGNVQAAANQAAMGNPTPMGKSSKKFGPVRPNAAQQGITRAWRSQQHQANINAPKIASANAARQAYTSGQPGAILPPSGPLRKTGPMSGGGPSNPKAGPLSQGGKPMAGRAPKPVIPNKTTPNTPVGRGSRNVQEHLNYNQHRNERVVKHGKTLAETLAAVSSGGLPDKGRISA